MNYLGRTTGGGCAQLCFKATQKLIWSLKKKDTGGVVSVVILGRLRRSTRGFSAPSEKDAANIVDGVAERISEDQKLKKLAFGSIDLIGVRSQFQTSIRV